MERYAIFQSKAVVILRKGCVFFHDDFPGEQQFVLRLARATNAMAVPVSDFVYFTTSADMHGKSEVKAQIHVQLPYNSEPKGVAGHEASVGDRSGAAEGLVRIEIPLWVLWC